MEHQTPSNHPTVELNHEEITTLRSIIDTPAINRELGRVHDNYLAGEYDTADAERRAQIDDLEINTWALLTIDAALTNASNLPIDVHAQLRKEIDHYHQVRYRPPTGHDSTPGSEGADEDSDDDIIVTDGGTPVELTEAERAAFESVAGEGYVDLETELDQPDDFFESHTAYLVIDDVRMEFPEPSMCVNTDKAPSPEHPHYFIYDFGEYRLTVRDIVCPSEMRAESKYRVEKVAADGSGDSRGDE